LRRHPKTIPAICRAGLRRAARLLVRLFASKNALLVIDESHQTVPQLGAMYKGDRSRKERWSNTDFDCRRRWITGPCDSRNSSICRRRPSTCRRRPSAYEKRLSGQVIEQVVRPTGLIDPVVEIRPVRAQVDDLLSEIRLRRRSMSAYW